MKYEFVLTAKTDLLMHWDNIEGGDEVRDWRISPDNQDIEGKAKADDRWPGWAWLEYVYNDGTHITMPSPNLQACLTAAGSKIPLGKGNKTLKELAAGLFFEHEHLTFAVGGSPVEIAPFNQLRGKAVFFRDNLAAVKKAGRFSLFMKPCVPPGQKRTVRVRPRFAGWTVSGEFEVIDPKELTRDRLESIFDMAGRRVGLGDWRPGSPRKPGPFGRFEHTLKVAK